jgi:hypothetical protein
MGIQACGGYAHACRYNGMVAWQYKHMVGMHMHAYIIAWLHGNTSIWWVCMDMHIWLHGCMDIQAYGGMHGHAYMVAWLHGVGVIMILNYM